MKKKLFENVGGNTFKISNEETINPDPNPQQSSEPYPDWSIEGNILTIESLSMEGRGLVDVEVKIYGDWNDGAFDYEYHGQKGTHRGTRRYELQTWKVKQAFVHGTEQPVAIDENVIDVVDHFVANNQDEISMYVTENQPSPLDYHPN